MKMINEIILHQNICVEFIIETSFVIHEDAQEKQQPEISAYCNDPKFLERHI